ncbi:sensor histidine kinase [Nocardia sp. KC 131]|uniref:sensor histidine kinase n=1 Tax=Nocardia arseniciresistens TaxID=3392119 RepID=UPI00398E37ED
MFRARLGVRTRILAIALVPSSTLLVVGVGAAAYLVAEGNKAQEWASQNRQVIPSTRQFLEAVQEERQLTLTALGGDESLALTLGPARQRLDIAFKGLMSGTNGVREVDDSKIGSTANNFIAVVAQLTQVRTAADTGQLPAADAYAFFNRLLDAITSGSKVIAATAPNAELGLRFATGLRLFLVDEAFSRSSALASMIIASPGPPPIPMEEFWRQTGFYHTEVTTLASSLGTEQHRSLQALMAGPAWQRITTMENALAHRNTATPTPNANHLVTQSGWPALPLTTTEWQAAATEVNRGLIASWLAQNEEAQTLAEAEAADATTKSAWAGGGVIAVSLLAFAIAILLANRIIRRLERLRGETLALADERLPDMMRRLNAGEIIDPDAESPDLDYGHDEIGQVANAFQHAHGAAVAGAVNEARTREGVKAVFLNIAHRSQVVVHRQLEILDKAEERQEDPALLNTLFELDHLATRERRNAENLIILAGGRPGRQWRNPVPLIDVVRSAVGETLDYTRVRVARLPETQLLGAVVADLIHLLAELVDNATSFSPPQSRVEVTGKVVGKGVVTEISDQGMGVPSAKMARINELLRQPPDFGLVALSADARLGLFVVARLAARHHISIRLAESDYGGVRVIVLIPSALLAQENVHTPPPLGAAENGSGALTALPPSHTVDPDPLPRAW